MLSRILRWIRGDEPPAARPDPTALEVMREQRRIAERLAPHTGRTPQELLDYNRADGILAKKR